MEVLSLFLVIGIASSTCSRRYSICETNTTDFLITSNETFINEELRTDLLIREPRECKSECNGCDESLEAGSLIDGDREFSIIIRIARFNEPMEFEACFSGGFSAISIIGGKSNEELELEWFR
eukprot:763444-Hanusia_phi.AAC.2